MAINTDDIHAVLNNLIESAIDCEEGFRHSAEAAKNPDLRMIFQEIREQRACHSRDLRMELVRLAGRPEAAGSMKGALHRGWVNLKLAISRDEDSALVAEAQHATEMAISAYQRALQQDLPSSVRKIIDSQFSQIREDHARIRSLNVRRHGGGSAAAIF